MEKITVDIPKETKNKKKRKNSLLNLVIARFRMPPTPASAWYVSMDMFQVTQDAKKSPPFVMGIMFKQEPVLTANMGSLFQKVNA